MKSEISTGDVVRVTRKDDKVYDCFVIENYPGRNMFYGKVLKTSKDKVPTASWKRYGLDQSGVCQLEEDCKQIEKIDQSKVIVLEDLSNTKVYRIPEEDQEETFCLSEDFGGWSEDEDTDTAIIDAYREAQINRQEVLSNDD